MPRAGASRNCANCRAVKRRCDKQFPHCGQCTRLREKCPGYRDEWDLVFRNQTDQTVQRSKEKRVKKPNKFSPPRSCCLSPSMVQIGINYFLHHFVTGDHCSSRGFLNYVPVIFGADGEHPTLLASMGAVGLMALANSTHQRELVSHARAKYSEAIYNVNAALASPVESIKDSTLMSVISLGVFEHFSDFKSWVRHVQGAAALVVARGKNQFRNTGAILMFNQVRADLAIACMHSSRQFPEEMRELQEEASKYTDTSRAFWLIGVLATRCVTLLWRVTENTGEIPLLDLVQEATVLQQNFQYALRVLTVQEPYTVFRGSAGNPEMIYNGRFDLYRTSWSIRMWNNARILQMIVCEVMLHLLNKVLVVAPDLAPATHAHTKVKLQETLEILSKLVDDILATVPQILGAVSPATDPNATVNFSAEASVSGGYILTWCLYMVGKSPVIADKTRKWIIRRFQDIIKNSGIALAQKLLEDIVRIDQSAG